MQRSKLLFVKNDRQQIKILIWPKEKNNNSKAQKLSCRRETARCFDRVIEYFANSLKITHGHSK